VVNAILLAGCKPIPTVALTEQIFQANSSRLDFTADDGNFYCTPGYRNVLIKAKPLPQLCFGHGGLFIFVHLITFLSWHSSTAAPKLGAAEALSGAYQLSRQGGYYLLAVSVLR